MGQRPVRVPCSRPSPCASRIPPVFPAVRPVFPAQAAGVVTPTFLSLEEVQAIHANQLRLYGGSDGLRDAGLLRSALAQPEGAFAGQWLHADLAAMAAAYIFHLAQDHPFVDGNKRVALVCGLHTSCI